MGINDLWVAYQFDEAVVTVGTIIENAAQETEWVGSGKNKELKSKYKLGQLLDPDFRLPRPKAEKESEWDAVQAFAGLPGVRHIRRSNGGKK